MLNGLKTYIVAGAVVVVGALQQSGFVNIVPAGSEGIALAAAGLIMAVLRKLTNSPAAV